LNPKAALWTLKRKAGRRFRQGHPWIFASDLLQSPKGIEKGAPVELRDESGEFLARGYGNPHSLIAFRCLSRNIGDLEPWSPVTLARKVVDAARWRQSMGLGSFSHRLVFGEGDDLPGLVIDRFVSPGRDRQVLVLQILTAGMEMLLVDPPAWVESWVEQATGLPWAQTALVIRRDVGARRLEGLEIREPERAGANFDLSPFQIQVQSVNEDGVGFSVDLIHGQKTGFFFDQASNVAALLAAVRSTEFGEKHQSPLRVIDLFCYIGQWATQIAHAMQNSGQLLETHLIDASSSALALAELNVRATGTKAIVHERDIVEGLSGVPDGDIVICDPPAFIKTKKDFEPGLRGYLKVNTAALQLVRPGGWFVSCSCSHHLGDLDFIDVLRRAEARSGRKVRWVAQGLQAADHPVSFSFPEGRYLKCWIGRVES
jgi:23S rRNA (cytosine1962-C5)-methyltransferase